LLKIIINKIVSEKTVKDGVEISTDLNCVGVGSAWNKGGQPVTINNHVGSYKIREKTSNIIVMNLGY
jgi:hypothetical protein